MCHAKNTLASAAAGGYHLLSHTEVGLGMVKSLFTFAFLGLSITAAGAIDMKELAPCRPAAAKLCDRTGGLTMENLMRCGATLAANSWRVGNSCRVVLRRYGQL